MSQLINRRRSQTAATVFRPSLFDSSLRGGETRFRVSQDPPDHASVVVHVADDVIQRGEAMQFALLLHFAELMFIELRLSDDAPVVSRGVHGEARRERTVRPDDQRVAAGAAAPRFDVSAQELLHLKYPLLLIDDLVTLRVLVQYPIDQVIHLGIVRWCEERTVVIVMLEMRRIDERGFHNVIVDPDVKIMS